MLQQNIVLKHVGQTAASLRHGGIFNSSTLLFSPSHGRECTVTRALPVVLTRGLWKWISHINEKGRRGGLPDCGSHGSAVSTACFNSPVSANCWRTNKEAEAAKAAYHHNKSNLGVEGGAPEGGWQEGEGQRRNHGGAGGAGVRGSQKRAAPPWYAGVSLLRMGSVSPGGS